MQETERTELSKKPKGLGRQRLMKSQKVIPKVRACIMLEAEVYISSLKTTLWKNELCLL